MAERVRILILEDSAADAELIQRLLRRADIDFVAPLARDEATFREALDEAIPDLVLADYSLPGFDGLTAIAILHDRAADVPAIIVSGAIGEESAIETLKAGAVDYVLKDNLLPRLAPAVVRALDEARQLTERKRAEARLARQTAIQEAVSGILYRALGAESREQLGEVCLEVVCGITQSDLGFIGHVGQDGVMRDTAVRHPASPCEVRDKTGHQLTPGAGVRQGLLAKVMRDGASLLTNTPAEHPDSVGTPEGHPALTAFLGVPLTSEGRTGVVVVGNRRGGYGREDQETLESLVPAIAEAFERKRAEKALAEAKQRVELLLRSSQRLAESLGHREVLTRTREVMQEALGRGGVVVIDVRVKDDVVTVLSSTDERRYSPGARLRTSEMPQELRQALAGRRSVVVDEGRRALYLPLTVGGNLLGLAQVNEPRDGRGFSAGEIQVAESIADQAAVAIENARLFEAERRSAHLSESLTSIDAEIHGMTSIGDILRSAVTEAGKALGCESVALAMRENGRWVVRHGYGLPQEVLGTSFADKEVPQARLAVEERQPVVIEDALSDERVEPRLMRAYSVRSTMVAPLIVRQEALGAISFTYHERMYTFSSVEVDFARRLSASLALAVTNARLYEIEHGIAETLQSALLALPERIEGMEFAHAYRSATELARVGGDFYDLFEVDHDVLGVTIGDMSGHGIDAAALTSLIKNAVRAQASERGKTPASILEMASRLLYQNSRYEIFATVFFGLLHCRDGRLVYCNAGHTAGACVRPDGRILKLEANSPLIGAFPQAVFTDSDLQTEPEDTLFLYTDGLTEARRDGEFFGEERVFDMLPRLAEQRPDDVVRGMLDAALAFAHDNLRDDLAMLAVRRLAPEAEE